MRCNRENEKLKSTSRNVNRENKKKKNKNVLEIRIYSLICPINNLLYIQRHFKEKSIARDVTRTCCKITTATFEVTHG